MMQVPLLFNNPTAVRPVLQAAAARRTPLVNDPLTTFYRVLHGSADGIPDVTVDRLADVLICSLYDESRREIPPALLEALIAIWQPRAVYAKFRPRSAAHVTEETLATLAPTTPVWGPVVDELEVLEAGLRFRMRPGNGLSVGLYADMRETRAQVRALAAGRSLRVLNTFAYTCGFGVAALADSPASSVVNLDLSRRVLEWGMEQYRCNDLPVVERDFVFGDVFDWLQRWARQGRQFDLVILDPPSFARSKKRGRFSVERDYAALVELAARLLPPSGLLVACCNHAGLDRRSFQRQLADGLHAASWRGTPGPILGASALDYPAEAGSESHLKVVFVQGG